MGLSIVSMAEDPSGGVLDPQGPVARAMADLWWLMLILGIVVFLAFAGLLVGGLIRSADPDSGEALRHRRLVARWIGIGGIALPAVVISVVFIATLVAMRDVPQDAPDEALEIEVTGHQFWYEIRYPASGLVTANELHLPVGEPVALRLTSRDVIHSFWVPALGGKLDMLPERTNTMVLEADTPGRHLSRCAEFCGLQHAKMALVVVAEPRADFDDWISRQLAFSEPQGELASRGRDVFVGADCVSCHALRGSSTTNADGPDLTTLPARSTLAAGTLENTPETLARWIRDPHEIKSGVEMPATELSDADIEALLAYLGVEP